jgi:CheY-like chemotaxis protein
VKKYIFLAEDDIDDQEFLAEAFKDIDQNILMHIESSGEKALEYIDKVPDDQLPSLIILDYNLPMVSGHQILGHMNNNSRYQKIVKLVWSTSNSPHYEKVCLESGATAYFVKPADVAGIRQLAEKMLSYCL